MLAAQAVANAGLFGILALFFLSKGPFNQGFLTLSALALMFIASGSLLKRFGRLPLIVTWAMTFWLVVPHLEGGMMDGGLLSYPVFFYLIAGFVGACLLPKRDSPAPGAPP